VALRLTADSSAGPAIRRPSPIPESLLHGLRCEASPGSSGVLYFGLRQSPGSELTFTYSRYLKGFGLSSMQPLSDLFFSAIPSEPGSCFHRGRRAQCLTAVLFACFLHAFRRRWTHFLFIIRRLFYDNRCPSPAGADGFRLASLAGRLLPLELS